MGKEEDVIRLLFQLFGNFAVGLRFDPTEPRQVM
jgi:hypothetical protein